MAIKRIPDTEVVSSYGSVMTEKEVALLRGKKEYVDVPFTRVQTMHVVDGVTVPKVYRDATEADPRAVVKLVPTHHGDKSKFIPFNSGGLCIRALPINEYFDAMQFGPEACEEFIRFWRGQSNNSRRQYILIREA